MKPYKWLLISFFLVADLTAIAFAQQKANQPAATVAPKQVEQRRLQQSMVTYTEGRFAMKKERFEEAIAKFKQAIMLNPKQAQFRYSLAEAYSKVGKWLPRWFQLRQTLLLQSSFKEASDAFLQMWQVAANKGIVDVGTELAAVKAALGEPDAQQQSQDGSQTTWQYAFMAINFVNDKVFSVIDLRGQKQLSAATETVALDLGERAWKIKQRRLSASQSTLEYVPETMQPNAPQEQFVVERLAGLKAKMDTQAVMETMQESLNKRFASIDWKVLQQSEDGVLFEWQLRANSNGNEKKNSLQHEIVRLIAGEQDIHRLAYTAQEMDAENRQRWLQRLQAAELVKAAQ